jgi:hypothetical protein
MMMFTRRETLALLGLSAVTSNTTGGGLFGPGAPRSPGRVHRSTEGLRSLLYQLLGDLPDRHSPIHARKLGEEKRDGYVLEKLELDLNGIEKVPALLAKPAKHTGRIPAVLYNHSHGGHYKVGKQEFMEGAAYLASPPYAKVITGLGWAGLCIDAWVFGERSHASEMDTFKAMLWQGRVLWGMMVYDSIRAMDYLSSRPDIDPERIATLGMSMGSTMAWWLAALDERVKVTVDICCLSEFHTLLRKESLKYHGIYYYVPSLLKHFTTADINALIAPRPHLALAGKQDALTPIEGLDIIDGELTKVYSAMGVPEHWRLSRYDVGHQETPEGREEIIAFLQKHV